MLKVMWRKDRAGEDGNRVPTQEAGVGTDKERRGVNQKVKYQRRADEGELPGPGDHGAPGAKGDDPRFPAEETRWIALPFPTDNPGGVGLRER